MKINIPTQKLKSKPIFKENLVGSETPNKMVIRPMPIKAKKAYLERLMNEQKYKGLKLDQFAMLSKNIKIIESDEEIMKD